MDKIITLVILYYILKTLYRFLTKGEKKEQRPTPPLHFPQHHKPPPYSIPKGATEKASTLSFDPRHRTVPKLPPDVSHILKDQKRQEKLPMTHKTWEGISGKGIQTQGHGGALSTEKRHPLKKRESAHATQEKKKVRLTDPIYATPETPKKKEGLSFDHLSVIRQGIIMSEILRPPLAKRPPFFPPYQR